MYYLDYMIFMLPAMLIAIAAQISVSTTFSKYEKKLSASGMTGKDAANSILRASSAGSVPISRTEGRLSDHYDPRTDEIKLSPNVYSSSSISAIGVAAHEAGHAIQYSDGYFPMKLRSSILPVCQIGSVASPYLILFGMLMAIDALVWAGIIAFSTVALFQLVTLPVEFNASKRAISSLEKSGILSQNELKGAKKVLSAAAMTYVAALFTSFMQILYYTSRVNRKKR